MTVCVTVEHRFERTPDGAVWTRSNHSYADSLRYLDVFDTVRVLARVREVGAPPPAGVRADGENVSFGALPHYAGFEQFCLNWRSVRQAAINAIGVADALILKAPSPLSSLIEPALRRQGRPYAVQLIGDPWGTFSKGSVNHPLRPFMRLLLTGTTTAQCRHASAVSYVTKHALQARYPAAPDAYQAAISDVNLPHNAFVAGPRRGSRAQGPVRLIAVAALEQPYKGIDVLLRALAVCLGHGLDLRLAVVGDGRLRPGLTSLAAQLGVARFVEFSGALPAGERVVLALDQSDMFVMPSRQEGLPRAMVEAMARALPCIGSAVGGIPELLRAEDLVAPGDPAILAARILEVCDSPGRMDRMSERYLNRAQEFRREILDAAWHKFFSQVRRSTETWSNGRLPRGEVATV